MVHNQLEATVFSIYMSNIHKDIVSAQSDVVARFLPQGWEFKQVLVEGSHPLALQQCVEMNDKDITIFLDIDCIPLSYASFNFFTNSRYSVQFGALVGAAQRASHINNGDHLYVGPFCMGFSNQTYKELGSPSFVETYRGDVGEELTYTWQKSQKPIYMIYPSDVVNPLWKLVSGVEFGLGTTYEDLFYHAFCMRNSQQAHTMFIAKCQSVLLHDDARLLQEGALLR